MPVKETVPVWHKILTTYRAHRGSGLSAHALIHLTGIPWTKLREQIVERHEKHKDVYTYHCGAIQAELITVYAMGSPGIATLPLVDEMVEKYDPAEGYVSIDRGTPHKILTVHGGQPVLDKLLKVVEEYGKESKTTKQPTK